jgi:hypothetical protein
LTVKTSVKRSNKRDTIANIRKYSLCPEISVPEYL